MVNILLISENSEKTNEIERIIKDTDLQFFVSSDLVSFNNFFENNVVDVVLADVSVSQFDLLSCVRKLKADFKTQNAQILLLTDKFSSNNELIKLASGFIQEPYTKDMVMAVINSSLRIKKSLDILEQNNSELAKSLYQLDVLYNTSTQFAGSLDKENLILSMIEGAEKTLSFDLAYTLICNDKNDVKLIINSLYPLTSTLEQALKLRAMLNYREMVAVDDDFFILSDNVKIKKTIKQQNFQEFDLKIFRFDSLLAEIKNGNKFVGLMEVFRKKDFAQDDATCLQTLSKQVSVPLESASLYEELKETNVKLEKLQRLKSEFISIVSHELRTPLTALKNSLDIIMTGKTGEFSAPMEKFLNMAKRNSVRLSGIINDLLDLSKVEAGKMEFRFEKRNIISSIDYVRTALENLAKEKNISISVECDDKYQDLYIDSQRIEQVITNLLSNAIKFTPNDGKIDISTRLITQEELCEQNLVDQNKKMISGNYLEIAVKDNGIGIEEEDIIKVFDKFKQIENSLNRKIGGTGLGIPIAKQLVEAHRGFIWVKSKINEGSVFSIALPLINEETTFDIDFMSAISKAKTNYSTIGFIEIVEDCDSDLCVIDKIFENELDIIKKTDATRECKFIQGDKIVYNAFIPEADEFLLNFIYKKLSTYLQNCGKNEKIQNIFYSQVLYPQDGVDIEELKQNARKKLARLN